MGGFMMGVHNCEDQLFQRNDGTLVAGSFISKCYCGWQKRFNKLREEQKWEEASNVKCSCVIDKDIIDSYRVSQRQIYIAKDKFKFPHTKFTDDGSEVVGKNQWHTGSNVQKWLHEYDMKVKIK